MKNLKIALLLAITLFFHSGEIMASGYLCSEARGNGTLHLVNEVGTRLDAHVIYNSDEEEILFGAAKQHDFGPQPLFKQVTYKLFAFEQPETTLVFTFIPVLGRNGCTRAGCEPGSMKRITAKLIQPGIEHFYFCHEENETIQ